MTALCEEQLIEAAPKRWGLWATAGFSFLVFVIFVLIQIVVVALFVAIQMAQNHEGNIAEYANSVGENGLVLGIATIATTVVCGSVVLILIWVRKGLSIREYLGLGSVPARDQFFWMVLALISVGVLDAARIGLGEPLVPEFMLNTYASAGFLPLLWLALVFAAPLFEELFFRGFMLEGFRHSRLGALGAILITSGFWAAIHLQYGLVDIGGIFLLGVLLGFAKVRTGSLTTPFLIHMFVNLVATIEVALI